MQYLSGRFSRLWYRIGAKNDPRLIFEDLKRRYAEPHRRYHALPHILDGLDEFDPIRHIVLDPDAWEFSWFFHDAAYDTHKPDAENVGESADLASEACSRGDLPLAFADKVYGRIMATLHEGGLTDRDDQIIADVDLASLGLPWDQFALNTQRIREEYAWVPKSAFRAKRARILENFLKREEIYYTSYFRAKYEAKARENLARAVRELLRPR